jgi:YhcH/YjgK/YiaL family protein
MSKTRYDLNPNVQKALEFMKTTDLNQLPAGKHVIDGDNLWVNIVDSDLKPTSAARLEAHAQYIDVQIPLSGPETFGIKPVAECTSPDGEMNPEKDILFYKDPVEETVTIQPGEAVIFGPDTAHAPLIGEGRIHKAIFKARVTKG